MREKLYDEKMVTEGLERVARTLYEDKRDLEAMLAASSSKLAIARAALEKIAEGEHESHAILIAREGLEKSK